jgi:nucleotide-binding universal stress UspA family protein
MYRKILVPIDGSTGAEITLPFAKELAARMQGVEVALLHIVAPEERGKLEPMHRAYISATAESIRSQAQEIQKKVGVKPTGDSVKVTGDMVVGFPDDEIPRFADAKGVDLILMSTQEDPGGSRRALGHVAEKIMRQSKIPVWLVRAGLRDAIPYDKWTKKTLLVVLDGSETAESVLPHAETLARQAGETVEAVLIRVCEPPPMPSYYSMELSGVPLNWGQYVKQELDQCKQIAKAYLDGIEKRLNDKNISARSEILLGKASTEIINYAANNPQSIIMMTTHGRSGLGRLVYGSVAESVLLGASNPIFLVRITK